MRKHLQTWDPSDTFYSVWYRINASDCCVACLHLKGNWIVSLKNRIKTRILFFSREIMAKWTKLVSPQYSDNDDTYETDTNIVCSDEPIDLKQVNCEPNHSHEDGSCDWETSKLVKTKAFRIKDILGLDESEKLAKTPQSIQNGLAALTKSTTTPPSAASML